MRRLLPLILFALATGAAQAADQTFYLGAGISRNQLSEVTDAGADFSDIDKSSWKAYVGFRPLSFIGAELDYLDLGRETSTFVGGTVSSSDAKAFAGYAVGFLPIPVPFLDVFGKAGLSRWQLDGTNTPPVPLVPVGGGGTGPSIFSFSSRGTSFAYGAGAQLHIGNIGARLEYEKFNISNTSGVGVASLSVFLNLF